MVPLLQVYSNPVPGQVSPQELLFRSSSSKRPEGTSLKSRRTARQLRSHEIDEVVSRYDEITNIRQVAREFRLSRTTVARLLADRGVNTSRSMTPAEVKVAAEMYRRGESSGTIGVSLGFDNHTILKALRNAGVAIRVQLGR